jgi:hypothetical protein
LREVLFRWRSVSRKGANRNQTTQLNSVSLSGGWYNSGLLRKINRPLLQGGSTRCRSEF